MKAAILLLAGAFAAGAAGGWLSAGLHPRPLLAVVDLSGMVRERHAAASTRLLQEGAPAGPDNAAFARALDAAVLAASRDCRCTLLVREAVVAGALPDRTAEVAAYLHRAETRP